MKPGIAPRPLRLAAQIAIPVAAAGSVIFTLQVGHRNPSRLLLALFTGWVLAPFLALAWCQVASKHWSGSRQAALHVLTLVVAAGSLLIYGSVAGGFAQTKPAFCFLVLPLVSLVPIAFVATVGFGKSSRNLPSMPPPPGEGGPP